ncbi:aromatic ring-hydroxylating oxygenase subunit alpha [Pseudonocardia acaciae]|uniref:aromatic ring-hydroxylating oxygenase subunit alpha n=1 Tax=Pseudonocardia acaciae TaxID=551276 RepID=UPI00049144FD|nr:aromatic ring-hydroxylating dioxygenase subunit alpha [Pseudonocardia acaciae]
MTVDNDTRTDPGIDLTGPATPWNDRYPFLGTGPVDVSGYLSEEAFDEERRGIFGAYWLMVGHVSQIPGPGDYFETNIEVRSSSLIITRDRRGTVHALRNICRHRGSKVVSGCGNAKVLNCPFHGWTYGLDGRLRGVPDREQFFDLELAENGLFTVHCEVWNGFIFVNLAESPERTLAEQLDGFATEYRDYPFDRMTCGGRWSSTLDVNWRVFQDQFQEGYHVAVVHTGTFPEVFNGRLNPNSRPSDFTINGLNRRISFAINTEYQPTPVEQLSAEIGTTFGAGVGMTGANPAGIANWAFDVNGVFPNTLIDPSDGFFFGHQFWPIAPGRTRWEGFLYVMPATRPSELISQEQTYILIRDAWREDMELAETIHRSIASGALREFRFSDPEIACRHSHYAVNQALGRGV